MINGVWFTLATCILDWYASDYNFVELRVIAERGQLFQRFFLDGHAVPWP